MKEKKVQMNLEEVRGTLKMVDDRRQTGIVHIREFDVNKIAIIGCGAIGSFTAISLAKMGLKEFNLFDDDKVEQHNLPNQFFTLNDIGKSKVDATSMHMKSFNKEVKVSSYGVRFNSRIFSDMKEQIVISCVDSIDSRRDIFKVVKKSKAVQFFIDGRMAGLQGQVYTIDMTDKSQVKYYEDTLFSSGEAVKQRCTEKAIIFTVLGIASLICNQIVKAFNEEKYRNFIVLDYSVPHMI